MGTFLDFQGMLRGWCDQIDPNLAGQLINYAWRDIRDSRTWSFLVQESAWVAAALINSGTVSVTNNSATITFNSTAKAALNAAAANPPLTTRQFRVTSGLIYNILTYNSGTGAATLDRPFAETTNAAATYQVYKCYYEAPTATVGQSDFIRLIDVVDPVFNRSMRMNYTRTYINAIDPQRLQQLQPWLVASYRDNSSNVPRFELWPSPTNAQAYNIIYKSRGVDLANDDDTLPPPISDQVLMERAFFYGYRWMMGNMSKGSMPLPALQNSIVASELNYEKMLQRLKLEDESIYVTQLKKKVRVSWFGGEQLQVSWPLIPGGV